VNHHPGALTVVALFSSRPLAMAEVWRAAGQARATGRVERLPLPADVQQQHRTLWIEGR